MPDFKPGDRVRVIAHIPDLGEYVSDWNKYLMIGSVRTVDNLQHGKVWISTDHSAVCRAFFPAELALLPPEPAEEPLFEQPIMRGFSKEEIQALIELANRKELTHLQVLRQALRLYQLVDRNQQNGHPMIFLYKEVNGCGEVE